MAYLTPFIRFRINGVFGTAGGVEGWSTGCKIHLVGGSTDPTAFLAAVAPAITNFHQATVVKSGLQTYLTELTGAVIGTDGKYVGGATQATKHYTYPTPVSGGGTPIHDWPFAQVLSLRSSTLGRGPASHGRMYWPAVAQVVDSASGRYPTATTLAVKDAAVTLLQAINTQAVAAFGVGCVIINSSPVREGFRTPVDRVYVGNRPDHIERRENAVPEAYSIGTV